MSADVNMEECRTLIVNYCIVTLCVNHCAFHPKAPDAAMHAGVRHAHARTTNDGYAADDARANGADDGAAVPAPTTNAPAASGGMAGEQYSPVQS